MPSKTSSPKLPVAKSAISTPLSGIRARPPLLASDALREDVAPEHPAAGPSRVVAAAASVALAIVGAVLASGRAGAAPPLAPYGAFACAVLLGVLAANVPYRTRAYAMGIAGAVLLGEGLLARGPAYGLTGEPGTSVTWEATRVLAATVLPAALFFRASYRAYPPARLLLAGALLLALPFVVRSAYVIALPSPFGAHVTAATTIGAVLLALVGFMGSGTTAMGSGWASLVLVTIAADVGVGRVVAGSASPWPAHASTAIAFLAGASLAAVGLFQTAALHLAADARLIDVKRHEEPPDDEDDNTVALETGVVRSQSASSPARARSSASSFAPGFGVVRSLSP